MKTLFKYLKYTSLLLVLVIVCLAGYLKFALPNVGKAENIKIDITDKRIERGKYLANSVCVCMDCHSGRDWSKYAGPMIPGTLGKGGEEFNQKLGFPGKFFAKNITPANLSSWTDGEILRAITAGVTKSGSPIFPVMPHKKYGKMDKEDIYSIIAYIRTLKPIENQVAEHDPDFPMNFIINTLPEKANFSNIPNSNNKLAYGEYIFNAAACADCHTKQDKGTPIKGMEMAGGFEFQLPTGGIVRSSNITPDNETGIGNWSEDVFVSRFKYFADSSYSPANIGKGAMNTMMPWTMYGTMNTEDLKAIFLYLKSIKPIKNSVVRFSPD